LKNLILFKEINGTGIVHLNRPKALNALNLEMAEAFLKQLKKWQIDCLEMEYQLSQHIVYRDDFNNGVDAILVSKTYNPAWSPASIHDINFAEVNKFFEPHIEPLNLQ